LAAAGAGPMHTDSSASFTYFASVSASEWTTTVRMPSSRHARWMRSAISPRLAIRIFSNTSADEEERLAVLHRLTVFHEDRFHDAAGVGFDLIHELHRLDDADRLALLDRLANLDEGLGIGRGRPVEGADHGRLHHMSFSRGRRLRRWRGRGCRGPGLGSRERRPAG